MYLSFDTLYLGETEAHAKCSLCGKAMPPGTLNQFFKSQHAKNPTIRFCVGCSERIGR